MAWSPDQELVVFMTGLGKTLVNLLVVVFKITERKQEARKPSASY